MHVLFSFIPKALQQPDSPRLIDFPPLINYSTGGRSVAARHVLNLILIVDIRTEMKMR